MLQENLHNGTFVATPPGQVPLTPFDLDVNGAVCAKPGFAPPPGAPFACGDRASAGDPRANGGWAPAAAAASTAARRRPQLAPTTAAAVSSAGDLYLDLVVRSLTDYLGADLTTDWKANAVSSTADTGLGSATASDADGTAWDLPLSLGYSGFGLSGALRTQDYPRAFTSLSVGHLHHLLLCIDRVLSRGVPGDLIEAGVFRGGATILMRAALAAREADGTPPLADAPLGSRRVFVADSFAGIPPSRRAVGGGLEAEECDAWDERSAVSQAQVKANFRRFGLLDHRVVFLPGFFNVSLPPLFGPFASPPPQPPPPLSIVRIDADAYDGVSAYTTARRRARRVLACRSPRGRPTPHFFHLFFSSLFILSLFDARARCPLDARRPTPAGPRRARGALPPLSKGRRADCRRLALGGRRGGRARVPRRAPH
jgi:hypothetical protein